MIERGTTIIKIMDLIDQERDNARKYCELNPGTAAERRRDSQLIIAAYTTVMYMLAE